MAQLNYKTLRQEVADEIRRRILKGEFKAGDRIKEQEMAQLLGVSRGPVREALRQLEQEGMVRYERNIGCSVAPMNEKDVYEISLLRAALEILAVRLCKGKVEPQVLQRMRDSVEQMRQVGSDFYQLAQLDNSFHAGIVEQADFHKLERIWKSMDTSNVAVFAAVEKQDILRCAQRHQELLEIYETQNEEKIVAALQRHYDVNVDSTGRKKGTRSFNEIFQFFEEARA